MVSVKLANDKLKKQTIMVLGSIGVGVLIFVIVLYFSYQAVQKRILKSKGLVGVTGIAWPDMTHVIFVALTCFGGVAVAETVFLFVIAQNYQPLDGNAVKKLLIDNVIRNINAMPKPTNP